MTLPERREGRLSAVGNFRLLTVGVTLWRSFKCIAVDAREFGDRYRGLNGWNVEAVTRVGPPAKKGEVDGGGNDLKIKSKNHIER